MSDYLPADIWSEIFLKLPVESLIRFTAVCKSWKALIVSPGFIYAHLSHSRNHSVLRRYDELDKHDHYLPLQFIQTGSNGSFEISCSSNPKIPFHSKFAGYRIVGSCDGIVCLFFFGSLQSIILWNPSVRNHVVLPQPITNPKGHYRVLLGFGFANHVCKVVRLVYCKISDGYGVPVRPQAEVFSIGTDRWRSVHGFDIKLRLLFFMWRQVLLKGIIHWVAYERIDDRSNRCSILSFDIGDEVFGEVMLPDVLAVEDVGYLRLYTIGGSLAVVKYGPYFLSSDSYDVWVMKEYGVKASWTKLYTIDFVKGCKNVERFLKGVIGLKNGEALLAYNGTETEWPDLFSYNLETKQAKNLEIYGTPRSFYIDDYVESLLLLKGNSVPAMEGLNIKKDWSRQG